MLPRTAGRDCGRSATIPTSSGEAHLVLYLDGYADR